MPTLVTCRSSNRCRRQRSAGYSLLEMIVVLAIMALVMGVAAVRIFAMMRSWRIQTQLQDIEAQFEHLPVLARQQGQAIELPPPKNPEDGRSDASASALHLPTDWLIHFDRPLRIRASGFCEGARIVLQRGEHSYPRVVTSPFCRLAIPGDTD